MTITAMSPSEYLSRGRPLEDRRKVDEICEDLGYEADRVRSASRFREDVNARADVAQTLRVAYGWSFPRIGHALGGKHHTSIMFLCGVGKHVRKSKVNYGGTQ